MAIRFKDLKDPEVNTPLTEEELAYIDKVEDFIDSEIRRCWVNYEINIFLGIAQFTYDPFQKRAINRYNAFRRKKMFAELESRYKKADWKCEVKLDTSGSMNECDYWTLTPKKI